MQTTHRFFHKYSGVATFVHQPGKDRPSVYEQATKLGGTFTRITKGLPEDSVWNFSPSIDVNPETGKTLITWRGQTTPFGFRHDRKYFYLNNKPTEIYIGYLHSDDTIYGATKVFTKPHKLSYEDPRLFRGPDNDLYMQFVVSTYASKYNKGGSRLFDNPKVLVSHLDEMGKADTTVVPPIGKNRDKDGCEKNWCFYPEGDKLHCLYSVYPMVVEREEGAPIGLDTSLLEVVTDGAPTFNSLPPLDVGYGYLIFYHWKSMQTDRNGFHWLEYKLGSFVVAKDYSKILYYDPAPIFTGSKEDHLIAWTNVLGEPLSYQPAVILPFGASIDKKTNILTMSLGINDAFMGIFRINLTYILGRMHKVSSSFLPAPSLPTPNSSSPPQLLECSADRPGSESFPGYTGRRPPITVHVDLNRQT